jgi:hypothetical protein
MTATYRLPAPISETVRFRSEPVRPEAIRAIIPTYRDWDGLRVTLDSLLGMVTPPREIIVVNDNEAGDLPGWLREYPVALVDYPGNIGPARARNRGFGLRDDFTADEVSEIATAALCTFQSTPEVVAGGICAELLDDSALGSGQRLVWNSDIHWPFGSPIAGAAMIDTCLSGSQTLGGTAVTRVLRSAAPSRVTETARSTSS